MYIIDRNNNQIKRISKRRFVDFGFKERKHLQEWIAKQPSCFGEDLLIIQKEFSGFDNTSERLDLLALDKDGNLVIIENKLDDSGRDVVWQALKYASYCSTLTKSQIIDIYQKYLNSLGKQENAQDNLVNFFGVQDIDEIELNKPQSQRIFFVAANFRKEVTSTVLYLLDYNLKIKCFEVSLYQKENDLLLDINQIIPTKGNEEYMIKIAEKNQENLINREKLRERSKINLEFWSEFLNEINKVSDLYQNISPSKESYVLKGAGITGISYVLSVSRSFARVEFAISTSNKEVNKEIFDLLLTEKEKIESEIGVKLIWLRAGNKKFSDVYVKKDGLNIYNQEDWKRIISFFTNTILKFEKCFSKRIPEIRKLVRKEEL